MGRAPPTTMLTRRKLFGALAALAIAPAALAKSLVRDRRCHWPFRGDPCRYRDQLMLGQPGLTVIVYMDEHPHLDHGDFKFPGAPDWEGGIGAQCFDALYRKVCLDRRFVSGGQSVEIPYMLKGGGFETVRFHPFHFDPAALWRPAPTARYYRSPCKNPND